MGSHRGSNMQEGQKQTKIPRAKAAQDFKKSSRVDVFLGHGIKQRGPLGSILSVARRLSEDLYDNIFSN